MNGMSIFGNAAISGVRRAADMESAAMARWTTRKFVHQYPNDSTNPRPTTMPNISTPIGFSAALPRYFQACVITSGCEAAAARHRRRASRRPAFSYQSMIASGAKPSTIRKNCSTSL